MVLVGIALLIGLVLLSLFSDSGRTIGACLLQIIVGIIALAALFFLLPLPLLAGLMGS